MSLEHAPSREPVGEGRLSSQTTQPRSRDAPGSQRPGSDSPAVEPCDEDNQRAQHDTVVYMLRRRILVRVFDADGHEVDSYVDDGLPDCGAPERAGNDPPTAPPWRTRRFLRTSEAAAYCRCGRERILGWEKRGLIEPAVDPDGRHFYLIEDLDRVMAGGPQSEPAPPDRVRRRRRRKEGRFELPITYPRTMNRPDKGKKGGE